MPLPKAPLPGSPLQELSRKPFLSTDGWAVVLAIALAVVVRTGLLKVVPW